MPQSPHCYFDDTFVVEEGDILVDVGAAEGMVSLDSVERASKVYLLECDDRWKDNLSKTFKPWENKIEIISKYANNCDSKDNISLDTLLKNERASIVLKIEVEGMEEQVLEGAAEVLQRKTTKVALCTYHRAEDAEKFLALLKKYNFNTKLVEGYMIMSYSPPYFMKGVLRGWKE